jgi:hypothetical protein
MTKKYRYRIEHLYPPAFAVVGGQRYLFPGWIPVDDDVTSEDVEHINPYANLKKETFTVTGSTGHTYTITRRENALMCNCPAGKFRGTCKHINQMKAQLNLS